MKKNKIYKIIAVTVWNLWFKILALQYLIKPKKELLVYLGVNRGSSLDRLHWQYKKCIAIEADPNHYAYLKEKYKNEKHIQLLHAAATDTDGTVVLNIASNDGKSSSLGNFDEAFKDNFTMVQSVTVPAINICNYFKANNITYITDYISDIQGMDLTVLKTMQYYINHKLIGTIVSETVKNEFKNIYKNLPDNSIGGFEALLNNNYTLTAQGIGLLTKGVFATIPANYKEMDCMWSLK